MWIFMDMSWYVINITSYSRNFTNMSHLCASHMRRSDSAYAFRDVDDPKESFRPHWICWLPKNTRPGKREQKTNWKDPPNFIAG